MGSVFLGLRCLPTSHKKDNRLICVKPFQTIEMFHKATYNEVRIARCIYLGVRGYNLQKCIFFLSVKVHFVLVVINSADPDEIRHYAVFHLSLNP